MKDAIGRRILSYLWGIETSLQSPLKPISTRGFYLTYEELKPRSRFPPNPAERRILSYLWGIETSVTISTKSGRTPDFILPMRNWNRPPPFENPSQYAGFYLTYEELKPVLRRYYRGSFPDFILPMRNWNDDGCHRVQHGLSRILSYLWGIETQKLLPLCRPRKRDFILPMRNWNNRIVSAVTRTNRGFYLTYEELKPVTIWPIGAMPTGFYLTYEELKLNLAKVMEHSNYKDFILPMRNWNSMVSKYWRTPHSILSYLWGIET